MDTLKIQNLRDNYAICRNSTYDYYAYDTKRFHLFNTKDLGLVTLYPVGLDGVIDYELVVTMERSRLTTVPVQIPLPSKG